VTSPGSPQDTRHLVLDTSATPALGAYQPGDLLCIFPRTPQAAVQVCVVCVAHAVPWIW
jgi:sulfite reductase alpha subunit-like flavoprotein